jgi:hypothetical protein
VYYLLGRLRPVENQWVQLTANAHAQMAIAVKLQVTVDVSEEDLFPF